MKVPSLEYEKKLWRQGYRHIAGIDEVGRGAWAGPVVVGAVIFPEGLEIPQGLKDSKQLKAAEREKFADIIKTEALSFSVGISSVVLINRFGIGKATQMAMRQAIKNLHIPPDFHIIDAFYVNHIKKATQLPIKKGDECAVTIAAASVIAKVFRDNLMVQLGKKFPGYFFEFHKGYGTKKHQEAIRRFGFSRVHRKSFDLAWVLR